MYKILAVDDEIEICRIIDTFLTKKGFQVITAQSAEQARDIFDKEKPDLLILDKKMPGMGGLGLLKELRDKKINIPIIILTGSQDLTGATLDEIKKMGYNDYIFKPVDLNALLENIKRRLKIE